MSKLLVIGLDIRTTTLLNSARLLFLLRIFDTKLLVASPREDLVRLWRPRPHARQDESRCFFVELVMKPFGDCVEVDQCGHWQVADEEHAKGVVPDEGIQ